MRLQAISALAVAFLCAAVEASEERPGKRIPVTERKALEAFFLATGGHDWTDSTGWLGANGTECDWYGLICGVNESGQLTITGITLRNNNLRGVLPKELSDLSNLSALYIPGNVLRVVLPADMLERLDSGELRISLAGSSLREFPTEIVLEASPTSTRCSAYAITVYSSNRIEIQEEFCSGGAQSVQDMCRTRTGGVGSGGFLKLGRMVQKLLNSEIRFPEHVATGITVYRLSMRVNGEMQRFVYYGEAAPIEVWAASQIIEGVAARAFWTNETEAKEPCSIRWRF